MSTQPPAACDILLVEDSFDDVFFLGRAREKLGLEIRLIHVDHSLKAKELLAASGTAAAQSGQPMPVLPRLIVSDLKMPVWDGIEFLKWVKSDPRLAKVPFVMLSSSALDRDIDSAYAAGALAYFVKPRTLPGFVQLLLELQPYWVNDDPKPMRRTEG